MTFFSIYHPYSSDQVVNVINSKDKRKEQTREELGRLTFTTGWASLSDTRISLTCQQLPLRPCKKQLGYQESGKGQEKGKDNETTEKVESEDHGDVSLNALSEKYFINKQTNFLGGTERWKVNIQLGSTKYKSSETRGEALDSSYLWFNQVLTVLHHKFHKKAIESMCCLQAVLVPVPAGQLERFAL